MISEIDIGPLSPSLLFLSFSLLLLSLFLTLSPIHNVSVLRRDIAKKLAINKYLKILSCFQSYP